MSQSIYCVSGAGFLYLGNLGRDTDFPVVVHVSCLPLTLEGGRLAQTGLQASNSLCGTECSLELLILLSLYQIPKHSLSIRSTGDGARASCVLGRHSSN